MEIIDVSYTGKVAIRYNRPVIARNVINDIPDEMISVEICYYTECDPVRYSITSFTSEEMIIQLDPDDPKQVSRQDFPDHLNITLLSDYFAKEINGHEHIQERRLEMFDDVLQYSNVRAQLP